MLYPWGKSIWDLIDAMPQTYLKYSDEKIFITVGNQALTNIP
jgi:hypothetical protein